MGSAVEWRLDEKFFAEVVLGTKAFDYLMSSSDVTAECSFSAIGIHENLQNKLSDLLKHPNSTNFSWNYAIFWQLSRSESGELFLVWHDGCCREPEEDEEPQVTEFFNIRLLDEFSQNMRIGVLRKLHTSFGGREEDNYARGDKVTDIEMFFLASKYFVFPRGEGGPGRCYGDSKHLWLSDALRSSYDYCVRSDLARMAKMQTIVLVPTNAGLVELGSVKSIPECLGFVRVIESTFTSLLRDKAVAVVNDKKVDGTTPSTDFVIRNRQEVVPNIFGHDLNLGANLAVRKSEDERRGISANVVDREAITNTPSSSHAATRTSYSNAEQANAVEISRDIYELVDLQHQNMTQMHLDSAAATSSAIILESEQSALEVSRRDEEVLRLSDHNRPRKRGRRTANGRDEPLNPAMAARQRREKINHGFSALRAALPNVSRIDQVSLLGASVSYITELQNMVKKLETEKARLGSLANEASGSETQEDPPDIEVQSGHDGVIVRMSTPLITHPASKVIQVINSAQGTIVDARFATGSEKVCHTFVVKSEESDWQTKERLTAAFSQASLGK